MISQTIFRWILLATLLCVVKGDALEFGRTLAVSLTRAFSNSPQIQNMPLGSRGTYTGAACHTVEQGVSLQTCLAATANDCLAGRGQTSPLIITLPNAVQNLPAGTYLYTVYVLLQPAFGLPTPGVQSGYSLDLRLLSQGVDADSRSLKPVPMIVQMPYKNTDCPTSHVAMGLSGDCGVVCMMYDSRLSKWSPIGITTQTPGSGVVNCSLSTLPAQILVSQFLSQIRLAMVVDKSANVIQNYFNSSLTDQLVRWSGATPANFRVEALRAFSASRLDMTRVFLVVTSNTMDPENIFQAIKRLPEGGKINADAGTGWTQGPLTILMVEKYYTEVPPISFDAGGSAKCFSQADCPPGTYCDEFSNCFSCGPGSITPGYCDSITYDCCSQEFRAQCTNNPYNCSDAVSPSGPSPSGQLAITSPTPSGFMLQPTTARGGRFTGSPTTAAPATARQPTAARPPSSPSTSSTGQAPTTTPPTAEVSVVGRQSKNGTLFRIISQQSQFTPVDASMFRVADNAFANIDSDPSSNNLTSVSLRSQGTTLTTIGEILSKKPPVAVYDELVQQGNNAGSTLRQTPLFAHILSIRMLCAYGLWRPRCSTDTLEGSLNATLALPQTNDPLIKPKVIANLEAGSGVNDRFVITDIQTKPNGTFVNFSIVPPEQGEPSSESIYDILSHRLPQRKTILVLMNFSNLEPDELPAVQNALCSLANTQLGITLTRQDLCNNITVIPGTQQQWLFSGPITTPLTSGMIVGDSRSFNALQAANNGTELNQSDITVLIYDSPLVPLAQACPAPFVRLPSGVCSSPNGVISPRDTSDLSLLAKILIGVFVGLALCALLCLCFCCWKELCCFRKKEKKKVIIEEPVTNITFIEPTPVKTEPKAEQKLHANPHQQHQHPPEISPLHKPSFSHHPISLDEHEGVSRDGFEYDSHSSDDYPDTERRSFHFRLEPKPTPPAITPLKLNSPSSTTMGMSPSDTVIGATSPYPAFMSSLQSPLPQRRIPPQPRTQPIYPSPLAQPTRPRSRKESLDAKHGGETTRSMGPSTPKGLQPSQRQNSQPTRLITPSHARLGVYQQTLQDQQRQRQVEQTPISSTAFSAPPDTDEEDLNNTTREYSDENTTRHGRSRSRGGDTPL